jgi:hypothetical protein
VTSYTIAHRGARRHAGAGWGVAAQGGVQARDWAAAPMTVNKQRQRPRGPTSDEGRCSCSALLSAMPPISNTYALCFFYFLGRALSCVCLVLVLVRARLCVCGSPPASPLIERLMSLPLRPPRTAHSNTKKWPSTAHGVKTTAGHGFWHCTAAPVSSTDCTELR